MKVRDIFEVASAEELMAMKKRGEEQGEKLGKLKSKLDTMKARQGKGTFVNRSKGRLTGRGRGTGAADQSMVQK